LKKTGPRGSFAVARRPVLAFILPVASRGRRRRNKADNLPVVWSIENYRRVTMAAVHSAEDSARYILTIFRRHRRLTGQTELMANFTLPFAQDGWQITDFSAGRQYAVEQGWIEVGKDDKFLKLTEAGFAQTGETV
jgi:hypothetical protein